MGSCASTSTCISTVIAHSNSGVSICLKKPKSRHSESLDNDTAGQWNSVLIDDWVSAKITAIPWTSWLCYNDEEPGGTTHSSGGHAKGVLLWNESKIGWLVHSVPKWPASLSLSISSNGVQPIPDSECKYGQSFIWTISDRSNLTEIMSHLSIMQVHIYSTVNTSVTLGKFPTTFKVHPLFANVYHIAKHSKWNQDLYENGIVSQFGGTCMTQTWSRPGQPASPHVSRVCAVTWTKSGDTYNCEKDHSKWAISLSETNPWVFVGDINAMTSQFHRGGGGIIVLNKKMWQAFRDIAIA